MKGIKILIFSLIVFIFSFSVVSAKSANINITSVEVDFKSNNTIINSEVSYEGFKILSDVTFKEKDDFIKYKITLKNNDNEDYEIVLIDDNNDSEYLEYIYDYNGEIKAKEEKIVYLTIKYTKEATVGYKEDKNIKMDITLKDSKGNLLNPETLDDVEEYLLIAGISLGLFIFTMVLLRKAKNKHKGMMIFIILFIIPFGVYAKSKVSLSITVNSKVEVLSNEIRCYTDDTLEKGLNYVNGQYTYVYMQEPRTVTISSFRDLTKEGWSVYLTDRESEDDVTSNLCTYINDKPIISMRFMFANSKTKNIDTSSFNTENVENMQTMFVNCSELNSINLTGFNTSNVTNMTSMFNGINSLQELNLMSFDTSNVTSMSSMIISTSLKKLDMSGFDISNFGNPLSFISNIKTLENIKTPSNYGDKSIPLPFAFIDRNNNVYLELTNSSPKSEWIEKANIAMLQSGSIVNVKIKQLVSSNATNYTFEDNTIKSIVRDYNEPSEENKEEKNQIHLNTIPIYIWLEDDTLHYYSEEETIYLNKDSSYLFYNLTALESIDLSAMNSSNTLNVESMFNNCKSLIDLDLSSLDFSNIDNTSNMILSTILIKKIKTPKAISNDISIDIYKSMIDDNNSIYQELTYLTPSNIWIEVEKNADLLPGRELNVKLKILSGNINTTYTTTNDTILHIERSLNSPNEQNKAFDNIISTNNSNYPVYAWFNNGTIYYYSEIEKIYLNNDSSRLFQQMVNLENLDVSQFDFSKVTNMNAFFSNCKSFTTITLSGIDTSKVTNMSYMFWQCNNLQTIIFDNIDTTSVINMSFIFAYCFELNELDLSCFNTLNVSNMSAMFIQCRTLNTVYVSEKWNTNNVTNYDFIFTSCNSLIGGSGTVYSNDIQNDITYARVDKMAYNQENGTWSEDTTKPGLLSLKNN